MDVNQKYCQNSHLISRNGLSLQNNELTDMLLKYGQCYQNIAPTSREYAERFSERFHPGPRQFINLVQRRNRQDRTQNFRKL
jgi:hypothetical protein